MKFNLGDTVKIKEPFASAFPDVYTVSEQYMADTAEGQMPQYVLVGIESHWAEVHLEAAT